MGRFLADLGGRQEELDDGHDGGFMVSAYQGMDDAGVGTAVNGEVDQIAYV
jgi:hypothetical protein